MAGRRMVRGRATYWDVLVSLKPYSAPVVLSLFAGIGGLLLVALMPPPLVMPGVSLLAAACAGAAAVIAWWTRVERNADVLTPWDISGAFALIGCAAAILGDSDSVARLIGDVSLVR